MKSILALSILLCLVGFSDFANSQPPPPPEKPVVHEISIDDIQDNHPVVKIHLRRQDSVVWYSKDHFKVLEIKPADGAIDPEVWFPFYRPQKMMVSVKSLDGIYRMSAGVPRSELPYKQTGEKYKPVFQKYDQNGNPMGAPIDPHISIHPDR